MGNSPSNSRKRPSVVFHNSSTSPAPLTGDLKGPLDTHTGGSNVSRRATTAGASRSNLAPPNTGTHRRARSALAERPRGSDLLAPPTYQEAVSVPSSPNPSSTDLLAVPQQGSNNPFRSRPVSFSGPSRVSGTSVTPASVITASPTEAAPRNSRQRWTTEEERLRYLRQPMRQETYENALETLRRYDTVLIVDDSGSMRRDGRWQQTRDALASLAEIAAEYDADGIDVFFLNSNNQMNGVKSAPAVERLFNRVSPYGATPIGDTLDRLLGEYLTKLEKAKKTGREREIRPVNYIVLTDGAATDDPASVIINAARRLDRGNFLLSQVGIQFVQIGAEPEAAEFLRQLDDDLVSIAGVRDIVDTTPYLGTQITASVIIKILLGGINRRVDRQGGGSVM